MATDAGDAKRLLLPVAPLAAATHGNGGSASGVLACSLVALRAAIPRPPWTRRFKAYPRGAAALRSLS